MPRIWFRLEDVLPLAEHALHCFDHMPAHDIPGTGPASPGLIWTSSGSLDLLTSTGLPAWHTGNGTPHAAVAHSWCDAAGRYYTAASNGYTTAYLPLTSEFGSPGPIMHLLRTCRSAGRGWVAVDIDPADQHHVGPYQVHVVSDRDDLVPAGTSWSQAQVTCSQVAGRGYWALVADGYTSNSGALIPRFTADTLRRITTDLDTPDAATNAAPPAPGLAALGWEGDILTVYRHDPGHTTRYRVTDHLSPDGDGRYPLGAYLWPWRQTTGRTGSAGRGC
ncbi:aldo-keto reductase family protein [Paractinoplanes durhamensis]|uniref:Uncharacterized protein n=1 Tax=Paractinoplanes durhamensis TaxID=113563 RepID=A0ABQ3Z0U6_9ACTN|nr:hypothetical protein [Actinoplanes durhamensis]GIE03414.1 hypothetical protein Adu01nite_47640 [Actinoplanes durhamensis]